MSAIRWSWLTAAALSFVCLSSAFLFDVRRYVEQKEQAESNQAVAATSTAAAESSQETGDMVALENEPEGALALVMCPQ